MSNRSSSPLQAASSASHEGRPTLPDGLGPDFKDLTVSEQINRLVDLHTEHYRRLNSHDAQHLRTQDGLRELTTDLADCRRQYAKYCVKVSGRGVPKPVPGRNPASSRMQWERNIQVVIGL